MKAIATLGSHSALQILKGAKQEGFTSIVICEKEKIGLYRSFKVADEWIPLNGYDQFDKVEQALRARDAVLIPHGSFVARLGPERCEAINAPYYGNKKILRWESDRDLEKEWLTRAGLKVPKIFDNPEDIDRPVIVKFHGADGGEGYFIAKNEEDFLQKYARRKNGNTKFVIQEYIIGVPMYVHFFYSAINEELEIMGFDKRYESNVDSLGRISARDQIALEKIDPSYVIVGNIPVVIRESFLPQLLKMGEQVIKASKEIASPGLYGPFCLEMIITPKKEIIVFEISARIVAGTNPYIEGSPYTALRYDVPMSTGRRIAREIKQAKKQGELKRIIQ